MTTSVTDKSFKQDVLTAPKPVLVDFWAPWCGPCRTMAPVVDELAREYQGKVEFLKLDVDDNQETARAYGIQSIPTFLLFKAGQPVAKVVGLVSKKQLKKQVDAVLS